MTKKEETKEETKAETKAATRAETFGSLREMLRLTRDEELDCDRFLELAAPFLDGRVDDPRLLALIEHHRHLCTECGEQLAILERAVGAGPTQPV